MALGSGDTIMTLHDQLNEKLGSISIPDANVSEIHYEIDAISSKLDNVVDLVYQHLPGAIEVWSGIHDIPPFIQQELDSLKSSMQDILDVLKVSIERLGQA